jgi:hypothetical protein
MSFLYLENMCSYVQTNLVATKFQGRGQHTALWLLPTNTFSACHPTPSTVVPHLDIMLKMNYKATKNSAGFPLYISITKYQSFLNGNMACIHLQNSSTNVHSFIYSSFLSIQNTSYES